MVCVRGARQALTEAHRTPLRSLRGGVPARGPVTALEADYIRLLCAVHTQLRAPLIVVWDT